MLFRVGEKHRAFVAGMRQRGMLVRDRSRDPGCDGCVRVTVGTQVQMDQCLEALREVLVELKLSAEVRA